MPAFLEDFGHDQLKLVGDDVGYTELSARRVAAQEGCHIE